MRVAAKFLVLCAGHHRLQSIRLQSIRLQSIHTGSVSRLQFQLHLFG